MFKNVLWVDKKAKIAVWKSIFQNAQINIKRSKFLPNIVSFSFLLHVLHHYLTKKYKLQEKFLLGAKVQPFLKATCCL